MSEPNKMPGQKVSQGAYSAFIPAPLPPALEWTPRLIRALSDADRMIGRLAGEGGRLPNPHVLIRPFIRREAGTSSYSTLHAIRLSNFKQDLRMDLIL